MTDSSCVLFVEQVCGGLALSLFTPSELELAVAGLPHLDFSALEEGARVSGNYPFKCFDLFKSPEPGGVWNCMGWWRCAILLLRHAHQLQQSS